MERFLKSWKSSLVDCKFEQSDSFIYPQSKSNDEEDFFQDADVPKDLRMKLRELKYAQGFH